MIFKASDKSNVSNRTYSYGNQKTHFQSKPFAFASIGGVISAPNQYNLLDINEQYELRISLMLILREIYEQEARAALDMGILHTVLPARAPPWVGLRWGRRLIGSD
jgi:hypothetical protein